MTIGKSGDQRRFRPDDDEIDCFVTTEGDDGVMIGNVERNDGGFLGDAGIARRGVERGQHRRGGDLPGKRMLAPARPDEKHIHASDP
jgi:hypothetical protein